MRFPENTLQKSSPCSIPGSGFGVSGTGEARKLKRSSSAASGRAVDIQRLDLPANDLRVLFLFRTHGYPQPHLAELRSGEHLPIRSVRVSL